MHGRFCPRDGEVRPLLQRTEDTRGSTLSDRPFTVLPIQPVLRGVPVSCLIKSGPFIE